MQRRLPNLLCWLILVQWIGIPIPSKCTPWSTGPHQVQTNLRLSSTILHQFGRSQYLNWNWILNTILLYVIFILLIWLFFYFYVPIILNFVCVYNMIRTNRIWHCKYILVRCVHELIKPETFTEKLSNRRPTTHLLVVLVVFTKLHIYSSKTYK